jgi:ABC-type branched-subunit amino acid transport system ATPase component
VQTSDVTSPAASPAADGNGPLLVARHLAKRYGGNVAVADVSLELGSSEILGLVGPNGAGKSTVGGLIAGSVACDQGEVWLVGRRIDRMARWQRARQGLSRTFQFSSEFSRLTVMENLLTGGQLREFSMLRASYFTRSRWKAVEAEQVDHARQLLAEFQLEKYENQYANQLSGGQRRLVEVMRALMGKPKVLILDEPMAGLNERMINEVVRHMSRLRQEGLGMLLIEHNVDVVGALADRVIALGEGHILAEGTPEEVMSNEVVIDVYLRG